MPVSCATCGLSFSTIGEMVDHISETNQGMPGNQDTIMADLHQTRDNPDEYQHMLEAARGFSHRKFHDRNNNLIPDFDMSSMSIMITAGVPMCQECGANFRNNYRFFNHIVEHQHFPIFMNKASETLKRFAEFEEKFF